MYRQEVRNMIKKLLRNDIAESSIMNVITQNVAAVLLIPIMAILSLLVIGSGNLIADANAQAAMKVTSTQFQSDIEQATLVFPVSNTIVGVFSNKYNLAGERLTAAQLASTAFDSVQSCRVSIWNIQTLHDITRNLRNITFIDDVSKCSLTSAAMSAFIASIISDPLDTYSSTTPIVKATTESTLRYYSLANRELRFIDGVVTFANPAEVNPGNWYLEDETEWNNKSVAEIKRVELYIDPELTVTGKNPTMFTGDRFVATPLLADPVGPGPVLPTPVVWVPNPVTNVVVVRCNTTHPGVIDPGSLGSFECVDVSWEPRPIAECGSYTVVYAITITNKITGKQTVITKKDITGSAAYLGGVWNGNSYDVTVTASCLGVTSGLGGNSTPTTKPFDQSLPSPRPVIQFGGTEASHIVSWTSPTTDPTVQFQLEYQAYNSALTYTKQIESGTTPDWYQLPQNASGTWTNQVLAPNTVKTITINGKIIKSGFPDSYRILASVPLPPGTDSTKRLKSVWGYASIVYSINVGSGHGVTVTGSLASSNVTTQTIGNPVTICPAGVKSNYAYESHRGKDGAAVAQWNVFAISLFGTAASKADTMNQGTIFASRAMLSCYTDFVPLPDINMLKLDTYNKNLMNDTNSVKDTTAINRANEATGLQQPNSIGRQNNSVLSTWDAYVRPISIPAAPANLRSPIVGYGLGDWAQNNWNGVACNIGTAPNYHSAFVGVNGTGGFWLERFLTGLTHSQSHGEASGSRYDWRVQSQCTSRIPGYDLPSGVSMAQASTWSGWADSWFVTAVRGPSVSAWNSSNSINAGDYYYQQLGVTCSPGNAVVGNGYRIGYRPGSTGYGGGYYTGNNPMAGWCKGAWQGAGAQPDAGATAWPGAVWVQNPPPPVPAAPTGTSAGWIVMSCDPETGTRNGFSGKATWNSSAWATSYTVTATYDNDLGGRSTVTVGTTGETSIPFSGYPSSNAPNVIINVRANGAGDSSGWASSAIAQVAGGCV